MPAEVFLHIAVSLDGYIERADHDIDWAFADDEWETYINDVLASIGGMIFGRTAHEKLSEYWPNAGTGGGDRAQAPRQSVTTQHLEAVRMMNELPKYVVSDGRYQSTWANSHILDGELATEIARLKREHDRDLALFAGARVAQSFMKLGLIDSYRLVVNPVVLGTGTALFARGLPEIRLKLDDVKQFQSGALVLTYS
ncbi:dihydrofolate reductase [Nocardia speluncae]|uniref:Dihydrofolate reductase n=1 Tax=Nocardia speluncae TaxID=419477 RepID=A0A846XG63_9NOCA|nr:dihydrofolate reductase family protein [Nocardia speluncae]NKY33593.1 dihydrofolate reductase [Nocardia speluncae]